MKDESEGKGRLQNPQPFRQQINTVVFGVAWGLLLLGPPAARRAIRRRRGRRLRCGYDLRGQTAPGCPECGAGRA